MNQVRLTSRSVHLPPGVLAHHPRHARSPETIGACDQLFCAVFEGGEDAMLLVDDRGVCVDANPAASRMFGRSREALIGTAPDDFTERVEPECGSFRSLDDDSSFAVRHPDGVVLRIDVLAVVSILPNIHLTVLRDVTEQRRLDEELRGADAMLRAVVESAPLTLFALDEDGRILSCEGATRTVLGVSAVELTGRIATQVFGGVPGVPEAVAQALAGEAATWRGVHSDRHLEARLLPQKGRVRVTGVILDITERELAQQNLRRSERLFRALIEKSADAVTTRRGNGIIDYVSPSIRRVLGYEPEEVVGRDALELVHPDDAAEIVGGRAVLADLTTDTVHTEFRLRHRDGSWRWIRATSRDLTGDPDVGAVVSNFHDFTEEKRAGEALRQSEQLYRRIVETTSDGVWAIDRDLRTTFVNQRMAHIVGATPDEMIGRSVLDFVDPEEHEAMRRRRDDRMAGERGDYPLTLRHAHGGAVHVRLRGSPLLDETGGYEGSLGVLTDLTEPLRAEAALRHSEDQLRQSQKMEAIGNLAGGVAHDFNNLLSVILGYADVAIESLAHGDPLRADLTEIRAAGVRARDLTRQLLTFSRKEMVQPRVIDAGRVLAGVEKMLRRLTREDVHLTVLGTATGAAVYADPGQLEQVLMNLVVNAVDAMPAGGAITIELTSADADESAVARREALTPGPHVVLTVTDTGVGMDEATQARIFEPFFTTKEPGKGTGLGLATVFGIVKQMGGTIAVETAVGRGARFRIALPRTADAPEPVGARASPTVRPSGETILLVEDEEAVRNLMRTILSRSGYHVLEAQNAGEAFLVAEQHEGTIHLLLTDVVMPRMSGRQLAARLGALRPAMKVLYVSGYADQVVAREGLFEKEVTFLEKPVSPAQLLATIGEVLEA